MNCKIGWKKLCLNLLENWMKEIMFKWIARLNERNYVWMKWKIEWKKLCLNELKDWIKEIMFKWIVRLNERNYV